MTCLWTFVHISDLHFGDFGHQGQLVHSRGVRFLWKGFSFLQGLAGHDHGALIELAEFYKTKQRELENLSLLVTGDLTSMGKDSQFDKAAQFICNELPPPNPPGVGLHSGTWLHEFTQDGQNPSRHLAIPGNHDHWPGRCFFLGRPRLRMRKWKDRFPALQQETLLLEATRERYGVPVHLRFLAVNTDADVWCWGPERVLAHGNFQTQIRALEQELSNLNPAEPNEIRVLLLHHSLAYRAEGDERWQDRTWLRRTWHRCVGPYRLKTLEMNVTSRRRLRRLLGQFRIPVILTGHTHLTRVEQDWFLSVEQRCPLPVLEACCGTTTQLHLAPSGWPTPSPDGKLEPNTLLVHRLIAEDHGIVWKTETWRNSTNGFEPAPGNAHGTPLAAELLVWRRP